MTMTEMKEMLENATLDDLLDEWELTSKINDPAIPTVRGWLMDELEKRNPEGFNAWLFTDQTVNCYTMKYSYLIKQINWNLSDACFIINNCRFGQIKK